MLPSEIEFIYQRLTYIIEAGLSQDEMSVFDAKCSLCGQRLHDELPGITEKNSYGVIEVRCRACQSFFTSNVEIMGVENPRRPNTSQKFGMLAGTGALITPTKTVVFMPPGSMKKLPEKAHEFGIEFLPMTAGKQLAWIASQPIEFPCLWVNDFGRKTTHLIANLEYSHSLEDMVACSDADLNSCNSVNRRLNIPALIALRNTVKNNGIPSRVLTTCKNYFLGKVSQADLEEAIKKDKKEHIKKVLPMLSSDPHVALNELKFCTELLKK